MLNSRWAWLCLVLCTGLGCQREGAEKTAEGVDDERSIHVAVAANFAEPAKRLASLYEREHRGATVTISAASSGKLFAQIVNGAPFDVFLSADAERPVELERRGSAVRGSRFCYARGKLVLYGPGVEPTSDGEKLLAEARFEHLALANPATAPYGIAARQFLERLGLWEKLSPRIVRGENITQAYQYVRSGGAELGLVALSLVLDETPLRYWSVPESAYSPIRQEAVLLERAANAAAARQFLSLTRSPAAQRLIRDAGYGAGDLAE